MKVTEEMMERVRYVIGMDCDNAGVRRILHAALADIPVPAPGPFVLSEHEERAVSAVERMQCSFRDGQRDFALSDLTQVVRRAQRTLAPAQAGAEWTEADAKAVCERLVHVMGRCAVGYEQMQEALDAVRHRLVDGGEPAPGPFVLSKEEADAKRFVEGCNGSKGPLATTGNVLANALDRARRTLAAPAVEPLSEALRREAEWAVGLGACELQPGSVRIAAELLRRCPKPEPRPRTAEELARDVSDHVDWATHFDSPSLRKSFDELVALAKRGSDK